MKAKEKLTRTLIDVIIILSLGYFGYIKNSFLILITLFIYVLLNVTLLLFYKNKDKDKRKSRKHPGVKISLLLVLISTVFYALLFNEGGYIYLLLFIVFGLSGLILSNYYNK